MVSAGRIAKLLLLGFGALFLLLAGLLLGLRAYQQHMTAESIAIRSHKGIQEAMYVKIGGIDQWIQIRGEDRDNPILLCVHGGPGATWTPLTPLFVSWEKDFTVVQWDQRGAGKTLESTGASVASTMSIDRMAQDGIEVAEYVRAHLHKERIILLGHSWGSILGVNMVQRRPDLFYAYVGTGQVSSMPKAMEMGYAGMLQKARASNDLRAVGGLEQLGPPPFADMRKIATYFGLLGSYAPEADQRAEASLGWLLLTAPNYSLWDVYNRFQGFARVPSLELYRSMLSTELSSENEQFDVPVFFVQGTEDAVTPAALAKEYLEKIEAPQKDFVPLTGGGHFAVWTMADRFGQELAARVRPLSRRSSP